MSLSKIIVLSVLFGVVVGLLVGAVFGPEARPTLAGSIAAFGAVIGAGLIQPPPRKRPENPEPHKRWTENDAEVE